ncbi:MAG: MFS transporter [Burkholderiales bacterium]|nr:MFS transporter [Burkholderiales bacterium]
MRAPPLARLLAPRLPFYYGWVILACVCFAGFVRQGAAVAVLSVFVEPMRRDLGWSSTAFGGAVSIGGMLAALVSPSIGHLLDRRGARLVLCLAVIGTGFATMAISQIESVITFYLLFCFARMNWAGPLDLGLYGALNAWFVARRARAASIATLIQLAGLVAFPLLATAAMHGADWRAGWIAIGLSVLSVGFVPVWLLLARRPEDLGLTAEAASDNPGHTRHEPHFSREQALRTAAFWLLALYAALVFPCQAGVSLYQASHMIERGVDPTTAALIVSTFSFMSALASIGVGWLPRGWPIRRVLALCGALMCIGVLCLIVATAATTGFLGAGSFGLGVGGMLALLPVVWADYFGRVSYGAIRGVALSLQVLAQACGPLAAGVLRDFSGSHTASFGLFATLSALAVVVALLARPPQSIDAAGEPSAQRP